MKPQLRTPIARLAAAHWGLALGEWTAAVVVAVGRLSSPASGGAAELRGRASFAIWLGCGFLVASGLLHLRFASALRREPAGRRKSTLRRALGPGLVLITGVVLALRDPKSPVYLAGLADLLAALIVMGSLSSLLWILSWRRFARGAEPEVGAKHGSSRVLGILHDLSALAAAAALFWVNAASWPESPLISRHRQTASAIHLPGDRVEALVPPSAQSTD